MKSNKTQMTIVVAAALLSLSEANASRKPLPLAFTPVEALNIEDRLLVHDVLEQETFGQPINWADSIIGINKDGLIEVRDKKTMDLQIIASPTCYDGGGA